MQFQIVQEGKTCKEIPEASNDRFSEKFLVKNCALSDAEDTSGLLNRGGLADLPLL